MSERQSADEIDEIATRWVWRFDREGSGSKLQAELDEWLAGDTRRRGAFLRAQATWALLDNLSTADKEKPAHRKRALAAAAGIAALALAIAALQIGPLTAQRFQTQLGEIRQVPLSDGSTAAINTASAIAVSMEKDRRVVTLKEGEAWFRVAKDVARPFLVEAGRVRVRAVGTAFAVRRHEHGADVLVTEGVVETWVVGAEGHTVRVSAGAKAFVTENAAISNEAGLDMELDRVLAWRVGRIDLAGEELADAIAEFNRYNRRKLTLASPELAHRQLYGVFRTDDPEGFANAVRRSLGASVSFPSEDEIRLSARP